MIRILNEADNSIEHMSDEQIRNMYDIQKLRVEEKVQLVIDKILEKLPKYKDSIVKELIQDYIPSYYFDNDELVIVNQNDDFEDRMNEIKYTNKLQDTNDDILESEIKEIIVKILNN